MVVPPRRSSPSLGLHVLVRPMIPNSRTRTTPSMIRSLPGRVVVVVATSNSSLRYSARVSNSKTLTRRTPIGRGGSVLGVRGGQLGLVLHLLGVGVRHLDGVLGHGRLLGRRRDRLVRRVVGHCLVGVGVGLFGDHPA